ncbi:NAD-dependent epimerase/dehydratase family protein [Marixanthomonas sp. SCSIO 43207]|uniref:NAD-dependent epimerase/dehydratase family protein n=1 Tax=Marixanthomonas sp. SCSIO 43207 TaxID=2779360 RepID=UPI001CA8D479|nr:NAD-dependent epimerase/dehydratase family protein [Marixanthomonas sp. SCSIO 43207]UAB81826.1 NAD-dependent epimerase/dehydratase family protein [Marixanthomonas sp. SCSIO 43207]
MKKRILIIGACGQIGTELTHFLREKYGAHKVIASDIREGEEEMMNDGPFEVLDAMNYDALQDVVINYEITDVYLMAAMLSATGEKFPMKAWNLNMNSLFNVLNLAKEGKVNKVFWPSSIAVFGATTPKQDTPQRTVMEPSTVYGISKQTGERWCEYYNNKYGVDVRSIRYPGIISYKTLPGGGTTDYAVDIYHKALKHKNYICFLNAETTLPMMYMEDAIRATVGIMEADEKDIKIRSSYNLAAISFNPEEISKSIQKHIPEFEISYEPDFRQEIADSWPQSIDDSQARDDWGWQHQYSLDEMTEKMLTNLKEKY